MSRNLFAFFGTLAMTMLLLASKSAVLAMYGMQSFGGKSNKMPQTSSNTDENVQQQPSMNSGGTTDAGGQMPSSSWSWKSPTSKWAWSSDKGLKQWTESGGSESGTVVPAHQPPPQQDHQPSNSASPPMSDMPPFGWLSEEARDAMIKTCTSGAVNCKAHESETDSKRTKLLEQEISCMTRAFAAAPSTAASASESGKHIAEQRLDLMHQLKQKMLKVAGLAEYVESNNDGTFEQDMLLTEKQSTALMNALDQMPAYSPTNAETPSKSVPSIDIEVQKTKGLSSIPSSSGSGTGMSGTGGGYGGYGQHGSNSGGGCCGGRKRRGLALFLDFMPIEKWDISQPISYIFDVTVAEYEREMVRQAHRMIQEQTCIRFQVLEQPPAGPHIAYVKVSSPTFCGLSYIGKSEPANSVYLSFGCQDPVGIAAHETMHALGVNHEHLRADRDSYIDIQWSNVNPQFYDFFAMADYNKFTTYGTPYDYGSIMHYNSFTAAVDRSQATMVPRVSPQTNTPLMGQRRQLSQWDVELLNKMYCYADSCTDTGGVNCGVWASRNFCGTNSWMQQNCRKSCNLCR